MSLICVRCRELLFPLVNRDVNYCVKHFFSHKNDGSPDFINNECSLKFCSWINLIQRLRASSRSYKTFISFFKFYRVDWLQDPIVQNLSKFKTCTLMSFIEERNVPRLWDKLNYIFYSIDSCTRLSFCILNYFMNSCWHFIYLFQVFGRNIILVALPHPHPN